LKGLKVRKQRDPSLLSHANAMASAIFPVTHQHAVLLQHHLSFGSSTQLKKAFFCQGSHLVQYLIKLHCRQGAKSAESNKRKRNESMPAEEGNYFA